MPFTVASTLYEAAAEYIAATFLPVNFGVGTVNVVFLDMLAWFLSPEYVTVALYDPGSNSSTAIVAVPLTNSLVYFLSPIVTVRLPVAPGRLNVNTGFKLSDGMFTFIVVFSSGTSLALTLKLV